MADREFPFTAHAFARAPAHTIDSLRYDSRSGTHNMYREYRELSKADAVTACYSEMASRHRVRSRSLQIVSVDAIQAKVRLIDVSATSWSAFIPCFTHAHAHTHIYTLRVRCRSALRVVGLRPPHCTPRLIGAWCVHVVSVWSNSGLQDSRRVQLTPFFDSKIKFALPHRVVKSQYTGSIFQAKRPQTTFTGSNVSLSTKAK